jgi:retinol dehydrogenase-12
VIEWLKTETGGKTAIVLQLDLADLGSVRRAVGSSNCIFHFLLLFGRLTCVFRKEQKLDVLFNNEGVMTPLLDLKTSAGYDIQFGTNVLGHYLSTTLLLPVLIHTAQTSMPSSNRAPLVTTDISLYLGPRGHVRVVNTLASGGHWLAPKGGIDYTTLVPSDPQADD